VRVVSKDDADDADDENEEDDNNSDVCARIPYTNVLYMYDD